MGPTDTSDRRPADDDRGARSTVSSSFISGTVTDEFGDPVVDVVVTAAPSTGTNASASTVADGSYSISVSSGTYDVFVDTLGYQRVTKQDVSVGSNETVTVDVSLPAGFQTRGRYAGAESGTAGVFGEATADSGKTYGVAGVTVSDGTDATGVFGSARSERGITFGVQGATVGTGETVGSFRVPAAGVKGTVASASSGIAAGVYGVNPSIRDDDAGVEGLATGSTGAVYGVRGETRSGAAGTAGVYGTANGSGGVGIATPDDARVGGTVDVAGNVDVDGDIVASTGTHDMVIDGDRILRVGPTGTATDSSGDTYTVAGNVVGGYGNNTAKTAIGATIGGGGGAKDEDGFEGVKSGPNEVNDRFGTVGGGAYNQAGDNRADVTSATHATVGGGYGNDATGEESTVGGGKYNTASGVQATVGGGDVNSATGQEATVGGGRGNRAEGEKSSVCGGFNNIAAEHRTTAGGGEHNVVEGGSATIGGGYFNACYGGASTIGGGSNNETGEAGTNKGLNATVPGGSLNVAKGDYSFAAGRKAKATDDGSFVWADSRDQKFTSNGPDQFVIEADGGVGIGTNTPFAKLEVENAKAGNAGGNPGAHVAIVDNTADEESGVDETNANGLAIKCGPTSSDPPTGVNFISFYNGGGNSTGAIQGNGNGGAELKSSGSDYAEYLPKRDPEAEFAAGDVVGVRGGELVADAAGADRAMVVSDRHVVLGNAPSEDEESGHEPVAFTGQVPVGVRGPASAGDLVVPAGDGDGTARAIDPGDWTPEDGPIVGQAWADDASEGVSEVTVAVGVDDPGLVATDRERVADLRAELARKDDRIAALEAENERLRRDHESLRDRVASVEADLGIADGATATGDD